MVSARDLYVATWLHVKVTRTETLNKAGEVVKLDPPEITTALLRRLAWMTTWSLVIR